MPYHPWTRNTMRILTRTGVQFLSELNTLDASDVGRHWNAVRQYLETGDDAALTSFHRVQVTGVDENGIRRSVELATDLDDIEREAMRGEVRFEAIYDEVQ